MSADRPAVCFVALKSYGILADDPGVGQIGGAEVQQVLVARELCRRGYRVSFVVHDYGQPDAVECGGIRMFKKCPAHAGWPGLRFVHPQSTSLWQAMRRADADLYYQRGAGTETGQVAAWCEYHRRPFVFGVASDGNCDAALSTLSSQRERLMYRYGVRRARVVCQTVRQQRLLRDGLGLEATLIRSCTPEPPAAERAAGPVPGQRPRILWVGRFARVKRAELLLDVAEACPEYDFDIVGAANAPTAYATAIARRAARLANVTLHGLVPYGEIGATFGRAAVVMCTSHWEGYPNTFLEAWARGVPTVSTVDPDDVITTRFLGATGGDTGALSRGLHDLVDAPGAWAACAERCRRFYLEQHTVSACGAAYDTLFEQVAAISGQPAQRFAG